MDEESDGRRKLFSKRKIDSLEQERALLIRLVEKIRESDQKNLTETIEIIRGGASLTALRSHLLEYRPLELDCECPMTRDAIADARHDLKAHSRRDYLDIQNIIE